MMYPNNAQQQQQFARPSYKTWALWSLIVGWMCGILGAFLCVSIIGMLLGIPLLLVAVVLHILGIVFVGMVEEVR